MTQANCESGYKPVSTIPAVRERTGSSEEPYLTDLCVRLIEVDVFYIRNALVNTPVGGSWIRRCLWNKSNITSVFGGICTTKVQLAILIISVGCCRYKRYSNKSTINESLRSHAICYSRNNVSAGSGAEGKSVWSKTKNAIVT